MRKNLDLADRDHGVDLVLEDKEERLLAVQVKFKTKQQSLLGWTKDRLSSWLAEADEADGLVLFTNASGLDKDTARKAAKKGFHLVSLANLDGLEPKIISDILRVTQGDRPSPREFFDPKPHQEMAIIAGHKNATTTALYVHNSEAAARRAVARRAGILDTKVDTDAGQAAEARSPQPCNKTRTEAAARFRGVVRWWVGGEALAERTRVREQAPQTASRQRAADRKRDAASGGPSWTRTRSQWIKNPLLYHLS